MISYKKIAQAKEFYELLGYKYVEVPWVVDRKYIDITLPKGKSPSHYKDNLYLVGSAEQSFLYLMHEGKLNLGKYQAITPCFRDDKEDALHQSYFMKLELFEFLSWGPNTMISDAESLFKALGIECEVKQIDNYQYDIVDSKNKIELGSYGYGIGINDWLSSMTWRYGTGIAEPRFSYVLGLQ